MALQFLVTLNGYTRLAAATPRWHVEYTGPYGLPGDALTAKHTQVTLPIGDVGVRPGDSVWIAFDHEGQVVKIQPAVEI